MKRFRKSETRKEWKNYILNECAHPEKNPHFIKLTKKDKLARLFNTGYNIAIEIISRFIKNICVPLTEKMLYMIIYL